MAGICCAFHNGVYSTGWVAGLCVLLRSATLTAAEIALLTGGGFVMAGIAYPTYAGSQPGWKIGAWTNSDFWHVWLGIGALAYLVGMARVFGWPGFLLAIPVAFLLGLFTTIIAKQRTRILGFVGPLLSQVWFLAGSHLGT